MTEQSLQLKIQSIGWIGAEPSAFSGGIPSAKIKLYRQFPMLEGVIMANNEVKFSEGRGRPLDLEVTGKQLISL